MESNLAELAARTKSEDCVTPHKGKDGDLTPNLWHLFETENEIF